MRKRLSLILIVLFILITIFVVSGCSTLADSEAKASKQFEKMQPELIDRYKKLNDSLVLAEKIGGKRDVTIEGLKSYKSYTNAVKKKNISNQLKYSRELEDIIGRLRANSLASVKLSGSQELKDSIALIDAASVSKEARDNYKDAVESYEDQRTSWRYLLSATICGYSSQKVLEFSEPSE